MQFSRQHFLTRPEPAVLANHKWSDVLANQREKQQYWLNLLIPHRFSQLQLQLQAMDSDAADNRPESHDRDSTTREARYETWPPYSTPSGAKGPEPCFPVALLDAFALAICCHQLPEVDVTFSDIETYGRFPCRPVG